MTRPTEFAYKAGLRYSATTSKEHKKSNGQFFTPIEIADFMAGLSKPNERGTVKVCDPGCGHGILSCAIIERLVTVGVKNIYVDLFETDVAVLGILEETMNHADEFCKLHNASLVYKIYSTNFIIYFSDKIEHSKETYDIVISNPPYFKLRRNDINIAAVSKIISGITNIYAGFIALSIYIAKACGECIFIVPRSFTSGLYFKTLRAFLFRETRIKHIHLFGSRTKAFKKDSVLQETLIFLASNKEGTKMKVSVSEGIADIQGQKIVEYEITDLIDFESEDKVLHLPTSSEEYDTITKIKTLKYKLIDHAIRVSTGRVVAFRSRIWLSTEEHNKTVPLIWGENIHQNRLQWPKEQSKKQQYISLSAGNLLVPANNYILQRRFSAKESPRRLICAPVLESSLEYPYYGFENKTNFFYKTKGAFCESEVLGLCALLNSKLYDDYFRLINGNVNVSATELRLLPMPSIEVIQKIGTYLLTNGGRDALSETDLEILLFSGDLSVVAV